MLEQGWLVRQKTVVTAIERADLRQALVRALKVGQRALVEPLAMQPPFAARRQEAIGDKHEQNLIPRRALAARGQLLVPEAIQLRHSVRASQHAPNVRGRSSRSSFSFNRTIEASSTIPSHRSAGNSDSGLGCAAPSSKASIDLRQASSWLSLISPRYKTWR
jgi:hypothetical protein